MGHMTYDDGFKCDTLEHTSKAIPDGTYGVVFTFSPHFNYITPILLRVPGRTDIRIHPGNTFVDSLGCILVGHQVNMTTIEQSKATFAELMEHIHNDNDLKITVA